MIKDFIWFLKISKSYTGYGYFRMIFKEHGLKRAICFCKITKHDNKMIKKYGAENYYAQMNRIMYFEDGELNEAESQ